MWSFFITIDAGKGGIVMAKAETAQQRLAREMEELYLQYRSPMFRVAMAILRDEGLAEDAVQQAFLKIFQNFENIQREDCNKIRSFEDLELPLPDRESQPEEQVIARLEGEEVAGYLMELEEKYRDLLILRYYHGYQNKEIARLLGMSQTQVALGIYRGKQKLRRRLEGGDAG